MQSSSPQQQPVDGRTNAKHNKDDEDMELGVEGELEDEAVDEEGDREGEHDLHHANVGEPVGASVEPQVAARKGGERVARAQLG